MTVSNKTQEIFTGVAVALTTLFNDELDVDYEATAKHAQQLVSAGVRAIVVCGTTAEPDTLSDDEKLGLLDAVLDAVGVTPVIMGAGLPSARQAGAFAAQASRRKVAGIIARSPRGVADPIPFYQHVAESIGDTPLLAYHFPAVSPPGIPVEALAKSPVIGVKDSSGDVGRLLATLDAYEGDVYVGAPTLLLLAAQLGCAGGILQLANAFPEMCAEAFAGQAKAQRELYSFYTKSKADFPRGIKELMAQRFGTSQATRLA
jgi:4-hydroxy-tetrahydrodipicolinate synthase